MRVITLLLVAVLVAGCGSGAQLVQQGVSDELASQRQQEEQLRLELEALQAAASRELEEAYAQADRLIAELNADPPVETRVVTVVETVPDGSLDSESEAALEATVARSESDAAWAQAKLDEVRKALAAQQAQRDEYRAQVVQLKATLAQLRATYAQLEAATNETLISRYGPAGAIAAILSLIGVVVGRVWGINLGRMS